ncbi:MAG: NAD-glutamate dehydrogenase, partial [Gammaproteobacteria bacterium]|nr:NAD-glutamate dehydrogenase [Gammaproteobacteria bacterium]
MTNDSDKQKADLLAQVKKLLGAPSRDVQSKQAAYYAEAFFRRVPFEELSREKPAALAAIVREQMKFVRERPLGEALISVFNPKIDEDGWESPHTIIEMVNDDMPFLVDTANVVMAELGLGVHLMVHPVIHVERDDDGQVQGFYSSAEGKGDPESIINMQIDRQNDPEMLARIQSKLAQAMHEVRLAVRDWRPMLERLDQAVDRLPEWADVVDPSVLEECQAFLAWLRDDHFILLGARDYEVVEHEGQMTLDVVEGTGLGILSETDKTIRSRPITTLSDQAQANREDPLIITKTRSRGNVHRVGYMDYVGVLRFDEQGRTIGERRFIGLFTSNAYFRRVGDTPLVRRKVAEVLERSRLR